MLDKELAFIDYENYICNIIAKKVDFLKQMRRAYKPQYGY